jgi:hypothetical protein
LPADIEWDEQFTRFILTRSHFARDTGRLKPPALLPFLNKAKSRWETSTHRVAGLTAPQIWQLGYSHVENVQEGRTIKARGTGPFALVTIQALSLDVNGAPYPRHVDIIGWSSTDKDLRLMKATEIADKLQLDLDPRR